MSEKDAPAVEMHEGAVVSWVDREGIRHSGSFDAFAEYNARQEAERQKAAEKHYQQTHSPAERFRAEQAERRRKAWEQVREAGQSREQGKGQEIER